MSLSMGIIGLPNAGKSTLFKALTKQKVDIAAYPFTTIHPNIGIIAVPDKRLEDIAKIIEPEKITPAVIEFIDIAGLVKGAHKGEGLGNQFLAQIRNCDALLEVVRCFETANIGYAKKDINPERDIETIKIELLMKDIEILENLLSKAEKNAKTKDKEAIKKLIFLKNIKEKKFKEMNLSDEEKERMKEFQFLTEKPIIYLLNTNNLKFDSEYLKINLKLEEEISELSKSEIEELEIKPQLDNLIIACYNILNLITFYTIAGGKETRAWTLKKGETAPQAGEKVHSDFKEKFIRAETIPWQKLVEARSWNNAKELGWVRTVGKEYIVQDGEVIEFKI